MSAKRAMVLDINSSKISSIKNAKFVIDTNVLIYIHVAPSPERGDCGYSNFLEKVRGKNELYTTDTALIELTVAYERARAEEYCLNNKMSYRSITESKKHFRKDDAAVNGFLSEVRLIINEIKSHYRIIELENVVSIDDYLAAYEQNRMDPSDYYVLSKCYNSGYSCFVTNDYDYIQYDGAVIFTANQSALAAT